MKRNVMGGLMATLLATSVLASGITGADAADKTGSRDHQSPRLLAKQSAAALVASKAPQLKISAHDSFSVRPVVSGGAGLQYTPYERSYKGLPVIGGDFVVVTSKTGQILGTSVAQKAKVSLSSLTPSLSKAQATGVARRQLSKVDSVGASRLAVLQKSGSHLVWDVRVNGTRAGERSGLSVYVDARSGKVLGTYEHVLSGDGNAAYSGPNPLTLNTSVSGSTYSLKDPASTTRVCQDAANNTTFSGPDDVWGNGNATSRETGCVDGFYSTQVMKAMLTSWLGRNGENGSGGWVPLRVGLNDVNAYYDGSQVQIGHSQSGGRWISSMDVVAHEYGHGIDDKTPGGISRAGTQEFVGDVFGALTEHYSNQSSSYDPPDYLVGEEIDLVGQGPIRNMYNPSAAGDPNCYSSSIPNTEVHAAAGPGNHWFYLLAEGSAPAGKPASSTCNGSSLTGIGIQAAGKIFYNAMLMKTTSSSYLKYRTWTLTAAKNLFPGDCTNFNKVKAAWDAVSVPAQTADPTCSTSGNTVTVNSPGNQTGTVGTATSLQLTGSSSGSGQTLTWSATGLPGGLSINATTGLISGTPTTAGTFNVTATAKDTTNASGSTTFTWTINPSGGGGCSGQKFGNPGFESGAANWSATAGVIDSSTGRPARTGSWKAWLNGYGTTHTDSLSQSVAIPAGCGATLSFWVRIDSAETTTSTAYDKLTVKIGSTTLATYSNLNKNSTYVQKSFNVSSFAGQTVTITFTGTEDSSLQTSFVIDDTALNLS